MFSRKAFGRLVFGNSTEPTNVYGLKEDAAQIVLEGGEATYTTNFGAGAPVSVFGRGVFGRMGFGTTSPGSEVFQYDGDTASIVLEGGSVSHRIELSGEAAQIALEGGSVALTADVHASAADIVLEATSVAFTPILSGDAAQIVLEGADGLLSPGEPLDGDAASIVVEGGAVAFTTTFPVDAASIVLETGAADFRAELYGEAAQIALEGDGIGLTSTLVGDAAQIALEGGSVSFEINAVPGELVATAGGAVFGRIAFGRSFEIEQFTVPTSSIVLEGGEADFATFIPVDGIEIVVEPGDADALITLVPDAAQIALMSDPIPLRPVVSLYLFD